MEEPERIVEVLEAFFSSEESHPNDTASDAAQSADMMGTKVLITAGPTYEKIDPVRFIGNYSSGKMGFALAEECARRGADVTLIAGPVSQTCSAAIHRIDVESCEEMYQASVRAFPDCNAAILCAAVADFRPATVADRKIKREKDDLVLRLEPTHDIAAALGRMKTSRQTLVGFALETDHEEVNAEHKLQAKNLDFIVLNSTRNPGTTFGSDDNQITIISGESRQAYSKKPKTEVACDIVDKLAKQYEDNRLTLTPQHEYAVIPIITPTGHHVTADRFPAHASSGTGCQGIHQPQPGADDGREHLHGTQGQA
jgi:phosphopantothenoylcysteine decarboxylase/phosphopantothenate--cysteine ligase